MNTAKNFVAHVLASKNVQVVVECNEPVSDIVLDDFKEIYANLSRTEQFLLKSRINRQIIAQRSDPNKKARVSCLEHFYAVMTGSK